MIKAAIKVPFDLKIVLSFPNLWDTLAIRLLYHGAYFSDVYIFEVDSSIVKCSFLFYRLR